MRPSTSWINSSIGYHSVSGLSAPPSIRDISSRFATNRFSRSASRSMARVKLRRSSSFHCTSSWSRLLAEALIDASGVRRSWEIEERRAARSTSVLCSTSICKPSWRKRARSIIEVAWSTKVQKKALWEFDRSRSAPRFLSRASSRGLSSMNKQRTPCTFLPISNGIIRIYLRTIFLFAVLRTIARGA